MQDLPRPDTGERQGGATAWLDCTGIATARHRVVELLRSAADLGTGERLLDASDIAAEQLPFASASFDVAVSAFGATFAPAPAALTATELARVCRPGGRVALARWTPDSLVAQMFRIIGRYVPRPGSSGPPFDWSAAEPVRALFGSDAGVRVRRRVHLFRGESARPWLAELRDCDPRAREAFAALDDATAVSLAHDLLALINVRDTGDRGTLRVQSEYAEVLVTLPSPARGR